MYKTVRTVRSYLVRPYSSYSFLRRRFQGRIATVVTVAAPLRVNISHNATEINAGIDEMTASGNTLISSGFDMARQLFADQARVNATKVALLLSDGVGGPGAPAAAALLKGDNVTVFAWGFGGANLANLELLATDPSMAVLGTNLTDLASYLAPLQAAVCAEPPPSLPPTPPPPPPPRPRFDCYTKEVCEWCCKYERLDCRPPSPPPPPPQLRRGGPIFVGPLGRRA